jgi:hypothetical protein
MIVHNHPSLVQQARNQSISKQIKAKQDADDISGAAPFSRASWMDATSAAAKPNSAAAA